MELKLRMQEIFRDENIVIEVDENLKFIYVEWQRHVESHLFRSLFSAAANIALEKKCLYWLSDARQIHFIPFADQNWMLREMSPLLLKSNLLKFARISNTESLSLLDVHRIYTELKNMLFAKPVVEMEVFLSKQDAFMWLFPELQQP